MMNNNYELLHNYSLNDLVKLKEQITKVQIQKAEELRQQLQNYFTGNGEGVQRIKEIEGFINTIRSAGLTSQCNKDIQHFYQCRNTIQQNLNYRIGNVDVMNSFLIILKYNFNRYDFEQIKDKFDKMYHSFQQTVNSQAMNTNAYKRHLFKKNLKPLLTEYYQNNEDKINHIFNTMFSEDGYGHYNNIIKNNQQYQTIRKKFFNAYSLLCKQMNILDKDNWKNLSYDEIIKQINARVNNMYQLCQKLSSQRYNTNMLYSNQLEPIQNNYNPNLQNSFSNEMGGYY